MHICIHIVHVRIRIRISAHILLLYSYTNIGYVYKLRTDYNLRTSMCCVHQFNRFELVDDELE